jgi:CRP-like cAMP-binding protein
MSTPSPRLAPSGSGLLARLPKAEYERLLPLLQPVSLKRKQILYEVRSPIDYAYFPCRSVVAALNLMEDGSTIEVASMGREGAVGLSVLLGRKTSWSRVIVQVAGEALRLKAAVLEEESSRGGPLRSLLLRYLGTLFAQISQAVACNGLHSVRQRCCRWLLVMQDRLQADVLPLTHEFIGMMLGVRRASVSEVLEALQEEGLIRNLRGKIAVLDRGGMETGSCECYRTVSEEFERLLSPGQ